MLGGPLHGLGFDSKQGWGRRGGAHAENSGAGLKAAAGSAAILGIRLVECGGIIAMKRRPPVTALPPLGDEEGIIEMAPFDSASSFTAGKKRAIRRMIVHGRGLRECI